MPKEDPDTIQLLPAEENFWKEVFLAVVSSANCTNYGVAAAWADKAVLDLRERIPSGTGLKRRPRRKGDDEEE